MKLLLLLAILAVACTPADAFSPPSIDRSNNLSQCRGMKPRINSNLCDDDSRKPYTIRDARYSDLSQVAELIAFGFHPELTGNPILRPLRILLELDRLQSNFPYSDKKHSYLVACTKSMKEDQNQSTEDDDEVGEVIGFCDIDGRQASVESMNGFSLFTFSNVVRQRPYLSDLAVHPNHRRQGIASTLMREAESRAKNMGFHELFLGVAASNVSALNMYFGMGYVDNDSSGNVLEVIQNKDKNNGTRLLCRSLVDLNSGDAQ